MLIELSLLNIVFFLLGLVLAGFLIMFVWFAKPLIKKYMVLRSEERKIVDMIVHDRKEGKYVFYLTYEDMKKAAHIFIEQGMMTKEDVYEILGRPVPTEVDEAI